MVATRTSGNRNAGLLIFVASCLGIAFSIFAFNYGQQHGYRVVFYGMFISSIVGLGRGLQMMWTGET